VLQVDAVIELVEVVFENFILEIGFLIEGGEALESLLSSVRINIFVKNFEHMAIVRFEWLRYVDDTCIIWKYVMDNLQLFMDHINNLQMTINFTKQLECNGSVPFLFVLVITRGSVLEKQCVENQVIWGVNFIINKITKHTF
jgi:hypothetical protein